MKEQLKSKCILCSLGCGFIIETEWDEAVNLEYDRDDLVNDGPLCSKGNYMLELINHPYRLTEPRIEGKAANWNKALGHIADEFSALSGSQTVGVIIEGDASTDDVITAQLFAEKCLGTKRYAVNFATGDDKIFRAIAASDVENPRAEMLDIVKSECILAVGDPFEIAPVIAGKVIPAKYAKRNNSLAVISESANRTSGFASIHLAGNERKTLVALIRALAVHLSNDAPEWLSAVNESHPLHDDPSIADMATKFVKNPTSVMILETQDPVVAKLANIFVRAAGEGKKLLNVNSYANVGGICEVLEENTTVKEIIKAAERGEIKALLVLGADIMKNYPGENLKLMIENLDILVAGAPFENDTTRLAHVVLPTALWLESEGTYNSKQLSPVVEPPGEALSYGEIMRRLVSKMGSTLPSVTKESALKKSELTADDMRELIKETGIEVSKPICRSTIVDFGNGSLTDNLSWIQMQERNSW